jgi:signal transduction histidine kinase/putative methionine-R-sulfoxide reductase with GAF domain
MAQDLHWTGASMDEVLTPEQLQEAYEERVRRLTEAVATRERQLSILSAVAARTHVAEDLDQILDIALSEILDQLGLKAAWIFMGSQEDRKLHLAASKGVSATYIEEIRREGLDDCLCPEVFWTGHRMEARNTTQCPRMPTIVEGLAEPVAHACVPLRFEGESRGVLNVAARPGERFTDEDLRFLETLGHQICIGVERCRHEAAERLRNQEARAMAAINKAIGGSLDPRAVLSAVGQSALEILGADRVQVFLGAEPGQLRVAHLSGLPHPELKEGQALDLVAAGATGQSRALAERSVLCVDDWSRDERVNTDLARRWGMASAIAIPLVGRDRTLGLLVVARETARPWTGDQVEVAESLAAQAAVALENARLYEESRQAYDELKGAQQRLLQNEKMVVLGTFASGLAHEVRNPLNSIALQLSILERRIARLEGGISGELQELAGVIRSEIRRLDALVGDFLLFSRANRMQYAPASLEELTDEVSRLLRPEARQTGVTVRRQRLGSEPLPTLAMDAEKMKQVVINLVRNAIEALPEGGVVVVETGVVDGQARLVVRDNGPGLPPELDIFQLFVTTKPRGTGLGLSIAQQIVAEHGGEITAQSEPGKGAVFTVSLPLAGATQEGAAT